jgi:curved DNA-binding protein CbpA
MADYDGAGDGAQNHYAVLGVKKDATQDEIKTAFRKLSKETHPDLNDGCSTKAAAFKRINNAHSTLSDPSSRRSYDQELQEQTMWRARGMYNYSSRGGNDPFGGNGFHRNVGRNSRRGGMHVAMETIQSPRFLLFGVAGVCGVAFLGAVMGTATSNRPEYHHYNSRLVEAWRNPTTNQWEQPAPWDPTYRRLKPKLELVEREKVRKRHI